jgi:hypothetical protein
VKDGERTGGGGVDASAAAAVRVVSAEDAVLDPEWRAAPDGAAVVAARDVALEQHAVERDGIGSHQLEPTAPVAEPPADLATGHREVTQDQHVAAAVVGARIEGGIAAAH